MTSERPLPITRATARRLASESLPDGWECLTYEEALRTYSGDQMEAFAYLWRTGAFRYTVIGVSLAKAFALRVGAPTEGIE